MAAQSRLIDDVDKWMFYQAARNQASHIYDEEIAQEFFEAAKKFVYTAKELLAQLEARND